MLAAALNAAVELPADAPRKVYALDSTGKRTAELPAEFRDGKLRFRILPEHRAMHYEVKKP